MKIDPSDPRWNTCLDEFADEFGIDLRQALLPTHFVIGEINGKPEVLINEDGMRAVAIMAPRPNAPQLVEELIQTMHDHFRP